MKALRLPVDLLTLSGVKSVIGIDVNEQRVRLVELRRQLTLGAKLRFTATHTLTVETGGAKHRAQSVRAALEEHGIKSNYAVSTVRQGVKLIQTVMPVSSSEVEEWLSEHAMSLLKLPVSPSELTISAEVLEETTDGCRVEVAFVRTSEIDRMKEFVAATGLELLSLRIGIKDLLSEIDGDGTVIWSDSGVMSGIARKQGVRQKEERFTDIAAIPDRALFAGDPPPGISADRLLRPFGLDTSYALPGVLARRGFDAATFDNGISDVLWKKAFQRVALTVSTALLILLLLPTLVSLAVGMRQDSLTESPTALLLEEVELLEEQLAGLNGRLDAEKATKGRTQIAQALQQIAFTLPDSLYLTEMKVGSESGNRATLDITGETLNRDAVTGFLRTLEENPVCESVQLLALGGDRGQKASRAERTGFELRAVLGI